MVNAFLINNSFIYLGIVSSCIENGMGMQLKMHKNDLLR